MQTNKTLQGKNIVVTGATAGIGLETARTLAARGAFVIGVGRSPERIQQAHQNILAETPNAKIVFLTADLSSQQQIRLLAQDIQKQLSAAGQDKLDGLINNAGTVSSQRQTTQDGYELQFAVNHLAPFLLTHQLLPLLRQAPAARIITVSSKSHRNTRIHWQDIMLHKGYHILRAYKQSKLANVLFTYEFNRRYSASTQMRAYAADPGLVNTNIGFKNTTGFIKWFWSHRSAKGTSTAQGAATIIHLAAAPEIEDSQHTYWRNCRPLPPSRYAQREKEAARLWELSEHLCNIPPTTTP